jgi:amino acid transporter
MSNHTAGQHQLKRNALGTGGIVFVVVAGAAPLAATLGASPLIFGAVGVGGAGTFVLAGIVLLLFAVGYAAMSRHVISAGGFAAYVSRGLGAPWGFAAAFIALLAYGCMLAGIFGQLGAFAHSIMLDKAGVDLPWQAWVAIGLAAVGILGYNDIKLSARVLGVLMITEVLILLILDFAVVGQGGNSGLSAVAFEPSKVFSGAPGVAVMFAFSTFVGFEVAAVYGEEAREPRRTVPRATYIAIALIALFYSFTMWAIAMGYGAAKVADAANADPVNFVFGLNERYVGSFTTDLMNFLVLTSLFAAVTAFHNTLSRYVFSLGRAGALPAALGRTHRRSGAPHIASIALTVTTTIIVGIFALFGADPFANLFAWLVGLGTVGVLALLAAVSLAVIVFFRRTPGDDRPWNTVIAPVLGFAGLVAAIYLSVHNFDALTGVTSGPVTLLPWLIPLAALTGLGVWYAKRASSAVDVTLGVNEERQELPGAPTQS